MTPATDEVRDILDELRVLGATITTGVPASADAVTAAEHTLGFVLPDELRQFFESWNGLRVDAPSARSLVFYALAEALERSAAYRAAFAFMCDDYAADDDPHADPLDLAYFPRRFVTVLDHGPETSEPGWGTVYDDEREGLLVTDTKGVSRGAVYDLDGYVLAELERLRDELAAR